MADIPHIMIVEAHYYEAVVEELVRGATSVLEEADITFERFAVPGALEIPAAIKFAIKARDFNVARRRYDGYIALGCVVRGETSHFDHVCRESIRALQDLSLDYTLALGMGILTVDNLEQAIERAATDKRDKGGEAASACLRMVDLKRHFHLFPRV